MNVLAVDPGKTTGWATLSHDGSLGFGEDPWSDYLRWFEATTQFYDVVVCESFHITASTAKKSFQPWSLEAIGVMRFLLSKHGKDLVLQSPGEAMSFSTNDKLKAAGMWVVGKPHARDAARHLLLYMVRNSLFDASVLIPNNTAS